MSNLFAPAPPKAPPPQADVLPDPPHSVLQQAGFDWGGIQEFNKRVQAAVTAHQQAHGTTPSAGLTLDVVRSQVPPDQYPNLFHPAYGDTRAARAMGAVNQHKRANPDDYFVQRPDGVWQPNSVFYRMSQQTAAPTAKPEPQNAFLKQHPMVSMGVLPIPSFGKLNELVHFLDMPSGAPGIGSGRASTGPLMTPGVTAQEEQALQRADQLRKDSVRVTTIRQAQGELNTAMGTNLPVTGVFNQTWTSALSNWMKTTDYAKKELAYQAQQEGFGNNTAAYEAAWHQKQRASQHGLYGWFLNAMPLALFGHGSAWDDLLSVPGYLKGSSNNPLNIGLHGLTKTAGLTLDTVGGTVTQAKADAAAGTQLAYDMSGLRGKPFTYEEALKDARQRLHENPTWMRIFTPGLSPEDQPAWVKKLDQATNVAGDLILLRKPALTGERVAAGDAVAAATSPYLRATSDWAYNDLLKYGQDGIGRASARLESGQGARALVSRLAKDVKNGEVTREQFRQYVTELYANGRTAVAGKEISGPLLNSLRSNKLPTPGPAGRAWMQFKTGIRNWADRYDASTGTLASDRAQSYATTLRSAVSHYVPGSLGYMDEILPERVFNFVLKHKLSDDPAALANRLESVMVKAQGAENIPRIQQVQQTLQKLYYDKNKLGAPPAEDPFKAVLSTEAPSVFHFPAGGEPELDRGFAAIEGNAAKVNRTLNKLAKIHARVILSGVNLFTGLGGFSLFWKHAIGDTLRVEAGGGGILTGLDGEVRAAKTEINGLAASNPELSRMLGAFRERTVKSEANWVLNRGAAFKRDFRTGDLFDKSQYMAAAGGYLRRHLDDPALAAYQSGGNALTDLILHDRTYRGMWKAAEQKSPGMSAEQYAEMVAERYRGIEGALAAQGMTFQDAADFYNGVRGAHADADLGKWIRQHNLDFDVHSGLVEQVGTFDHLTGWWVGNVIMKPNKLNRGRFAENMLARTYADLKGAGWQPADALQTATSVAGNLTKYHMLDFANRLQVEQDLRWLSYFATKHRLYWKWVLGTFLRHPGYAAAVSDFSQTLNQSGGWTLPFTALGQKWMIPLERLVWVPGREYDETSPLALAVWNFVKSGGNLDQVVQGATGTNGNVVTRSDTAVVLGTKLLKIEAGTGATYGYAVAGLDKKTAAQVTRALNEYQISYQLAHGHYDTEAHAVKKVLLAQAGEEYWRANLPLPVVPEHDRSEQQQLLAQFMQLDDPRARAKFMNQHPGFSDHFGVYNDPKTNLHNRLFFQRWTKAMDAYRSARADLYDQARHTGHWTTQMEADRRVLNDSLNKTRNQLLVDDARQAGVNTRGLVPNGTTVPYGPWGKVVNKDPQFDTTHALNTLFPKLSGAITDNVIGPLQKQMQMELSQLNDPKYVAASGYTPEQVKTRRGELIQKLEVFKSYPSDALGALHDTYQTRFVNKYWQGYNVRYNAANKLPSTERKAADAAFRAWRDDQDHPVTIDGVTFPSPVRMAWAMLDPVTRQQRLSYLASKPLTDLANYELDLLGVQHPPNVSNAVSALSRALVAFREQHPNEHPDVVSAIKAIDKQPGYHGLYAFYVNTLTEPRIKQFTATSVYQEMPSDVRTEFDQIATVATDVSRRIVQATKAKDGTASEYRAEWRKAVKEQITPWLNLPANKPLRQYLAPMGPNFLYTLVSVPRIG